MQTLPRGFVAGLIATGVLSAVLLIQASLGALPQVNMIAMLATLVSASMLVGWIAHFVIGALLWGLLYALIYPRIPGRGPVAKALAFAVGAWLAMMILLLPATGAGRRAVRAGDRAVGADRHAGAPSALGRGTWRGLCEALTACHEQ